MNTSNANATAAPITGDDCEVSVVMPCLNEADTVVLCVSKAVECLRRLGVVGEVLVADNGSTDGSRELARAAGARVVPVEARGYGAALLGGIAAARGRFVIMADADDSYDLSDLGKFIEALRSGCDLVQGCRLPWGGGTVMPGAMPFLHRWWGNPMFTVMAQWMFHSPVKDIYCGFRGFRREWHQRLEQRCTGMEFATEMLIKGSLTGARIVEVPITLHPDGRKAHAPHLKTFRDGWRTLRFFLLCSPRWVFLQPGLAMMLLGAVGYGLALPGVRMGPATFDVHTLLVASLAILCGFQAAMFAVIIKTFAVSEGVLPPDWRMARFFKVATLERGLLIAGVALAMGAVLIGTAVFRWHGLGYGRLDYPSTMRLVIPGVTLFALGFQTVLGGFFVSMLGMSRR
jgi:hypothetical protein